MRRVVSSVLIGSVSPVLGLLVLILAILGAQAGTRAANADGPMPPQVKAFIETYLPLAQAQYEMYRVPVSVALAQAAIETNWGRSEIMMSHNNFFALTSSVNSPRATGMYQIWIKREGKYYSYTEYDSAEDAWLDFGYFLTHDRNYKFALQDFDNPRKYYAEIYCMYTKGVREGCDNSLALQIWDKWTSPYDNLPTSSEKPAEPSPDEPDSDEEPSLFDDPAKWLEEQIARLRQRIEEWWEEQIANLERQLDEWLQRQLEELVRRLEEELEKTIQEQCCAPAALILVLAVVAVKKGR